MFRKTTDGEDETNEPTVIDLFSGAGGFSLGFEEAGYEVLAAVDNNDTALATCYANQDIVPCSIDLHKASPEEVLTEIGVDSDEVDIVIGGPPCQGHSQQGKQDPDDPRNDLMGDFLQFVEFVQPEGVVMENVPEIQDTKDGEFVEGVIEDVQEMGYNVESGVLDADEFGVPQTRSRFFLVGLRGGEPSLPSPPGEVTPVYEVLNEVQLRDELWNNDWRTRKSKHSKSTIENYYDTSLGRDPYPNSNQQVRLPLEEPGRTVVAENIHFHPHQPRYLTVREAAALQTFHEEYLFVGSITEQRKHVGNAVPPKLAEHLGRELKQSLN